VPTNAQMPILMTSGGENENYPPDVMFSPGDESSSSPFCDENVATSTTGGGPEVSSTHELDEDEEEGEADMPNKRGPKKQPMTRTRLAKVRVRIATVTHASIFCHKREATRKEVNCIELAVTDKLN